MNFVSPLFPTFYIRPFSFEKVYVLCHFRIIYLFKKILSSCWALYIASLIIGFLKFCVYILLTWLNIKLSQKKVVPKASILEKEKTH